MAFSSTPVQQVTTTEVSSGTIVFTTAALTAGNTIVICVTERAGSSATWPASVTLNVGSGTFTSFTNVTRTAGPPPEDWVAGVNSYAAIIYSLKLDTGGATTVTVNMNTTGKTVGGVLTEWNPSGATVSIDDSKFGGGGTANANQPDVAVTSTTGGLIISSHCSGSATVAFATAQSVPTTGWTAATTQPSTTAGIAWQVFTSAQSGAHPGWTTTSSSWGSVTVAFKTLEAGGSPLSQPLFTRAFRSPFIPGRGIHTTFPPFTTAGPPIIPAQAGPPFPGQHPSFRGPFGNRPGIHQTFPPITTADPPIIPAQAGPPFPGQHPSFRGPFGNRPGIHQTFPPITTADPPIIPAIAGLPFPGWHPGNIGPFNLQRPGVYNLGVVRGSSALQQALTATISFTSAQTRKAKKSLTATLTFTSAQTRKVLKAFSAALSFTGLLTTILRRRLSLSASITPTSTLTKIVKRQSSASLSFTSLQTRRIRATSVAMESFTGSLLRKVKKTLTGGVSFTGQVTGNTVPTPPPSTSSAGAGWFRIWKKRRQSE